MASFPELTVTTLVGGVGAARFLRGLVRIIDPARLTAIVNTGDDDEFFGLYVSPDLDTITYTLAGAVDQSKGWGLPEETFRCLTALNRYYPSGVWFGLGDADLATHLFRTQLLRQGKTLSEATAAIARAWGVQSTLLPMSDDPVQTIVYTEAGARSFQEYFVKGRGEGEVKKVELRGIEKASAAPGVCEAIRTADFIILPPSNPIVSIGPILALPGVRQALRETTAPVAGVSPLVAGKPIKGPADRLLRGLGVEVSAAGVAALYADFLDAFIIDLQDVQQRERLEQQGFDVIIADTIMTDIDKSVALARVMVEHYYRKKAETEKRRNGETES
ncbi:MAG TPA: 2-phospho-L-lactate transferase [Methylomirabilota bacterium]|nr:2-phospho-L-lactate transferase [Methylomirabilota bacterium]